MIPIVTPDEMRAVDAAAPEPVEELVERAGRAVAKHALDILGGTYGRRVVVVAGKGNNGADGIVAGRRLESLGVRVTVLDASSCPPRLPRCDLVIDAAYGTGFRGDYDAPDPGHAFVLAVDVPSGLDGLTGEAGGGAVRADATVTFAALKPGLVYDGGDRSGVVTVVDIGLDVSGAQAHLVEPSDVRPPERARDAHKYAAAVAVIAGSPGMLGAPALCARAALRSGCGYVRLGTPGADATTLGVTEAVSVPLPAENWAEAALDATDRMSAVAIGPGLGRGAALAAARTFLERVRVPCVVDGDGLRALPPPDERDAPLLLTPHEGEFAHLDGAAVGRDRLADVRRLAARLDATILLKGPSTVVAEPSGRALFAASGTSALATAGTGDVLAGMAAALLAQGVPPLEAAGHAAVAHGLAGRALGPGLIASDLIERIPEVLWPAA